MLLLECCQSSHQHLQIELVLVYTPALQGKMQPYKFTKLKYFHLQKKFICQPIPRKLYKNDMQAYMHTNNVHSQIHTHIHTYVIFVHQISTEYTHTSLCVYMSMHAMHIDFRQFLEGSTRQLALAGEINIVQISTRNFPKKNKRLICAELHHNQEHRNLISAGVLPCQIPSLQDQ